MLNASNDVNQEGACDIICIIFIYFGFYSFVFDSHDWILETLGAICMFFSRAWFYKYSE